MRLTEGGWTPCLMGRSCRGLTVEDEISAVAGEAEPGEADIQAAICVVTNRYAFSARVMRPVNGRYAGGVGFAVPRAGSSRRHLPACWGLAGRRVGGNEEASRGSWHHILCDLQASTLSFVTSACSVRGRLRSLPPPCVPYLLYRCS